MRCDAILGALGAACLAVSQGAMAAGHCAMLMPADEHDAHAMHRGPDHEMPAGDETPGGDEMKGCHACLRKRAMPIKG